MNSEGRLSVLIAGGLLAVLVVACALVGITQAKEKLVQMDLARAQKEYLPWVTTEQIPTLHAWVTEWICCDCGLVHRVLYVPSREGLNIWIWRLEPETKKERARRGILRDLQSDPWAAENPSQE